MKETNSEKKLKTVMVSIALFFAGFIITILTSMLLQKNILSSIIEDNLVGQFPVKILGIEQMRMISTMNGSSLDIDIVYSSLYKVFPFLVGIILVLLFLLVLGSSKDKKDEASKRF